MSKRKDLIRTYDYFKTKSFYGIGQRKAKLFMNGLLKKLDSQIKTTPEDKAPEVAERLGDSLNVRAEAFEKMVKDYVGTHRDNEGAMLLLSDVVSDIEQEYAQMSDAMKNSLVGKFYKERIDYANKL